MKQRWSSPCRKKSASTNQKSAGIIVLDATINIVLVCLGRASNTTLFEHTSKKKKKNKQKKRYKTCYNLIDILG